MGNRPEHVIREQRQTRLRTMLGIVWALPLTLAGIILLLPVVCLGGRVDLVLKPTPALLACGPLADWLLEHHPFGAMSAMALGHVVIARKRDLTPQILMHELAHVRQAARWGFTFPFAYLAASAWARLHGEDAYWNNAFEVAARREEKH